MSLAPGGDLPPDDSGGHDADAEARGEGGMEDRCNAGCGFDQRVTVHDSPLMKATEADKARRGTRLGEVRSPALRPASMA